MDDVRRVILERRTVHDYSDQPVPEGTLERALEAAAAAPNHRMTEPWRFTRVGSQARAELARISIDLKTDGGRNPLSAAGEAKARDKIVKPAELLVVSQILDEDPDVAQEDYAAIACAVQNIFLVLAAEGIGTKWSTGGVTTDPRTYALLGIDPAKERVVGFVWIGYSAVENPPKSRRRKSLSDIFRQLP
jgi:nitroreductase